MYSSLESTVKKDERLDDYDRNARKGNGTDESRRIEKNARARVVLSPHVRYYDNIDRRN